MFRSQATKQRMDHVMKQNEKAKDGPFYEAERTSPHNTEFVCPPMRRTFPQTPDKQFISPERAGQVIQTTSTKNKQCDRLLALFVTTRCSHVHDPRVVDEIEAPPLLPCNEGEWAGARRVGDNAEGGQRASASRG